MTQENKRTPKIGDLVRTTKAVGPFDKGSLLSIFEIIHPALDTCRRTYRVVEESGTTCVMFDDSFVLVEEENREVKSTLKDFEERNGELFKQIEELMCQRAEVQDKIYWMREYGYEEYDETRYRVWRLLETSKDEGYISRTLVDTIVDLIRK